MGKQRNETEVLSRNYGLKYRAAFNASNQVEYEGWAIEPTALTSEAKWQIIRHEYTSDNLTASNWAKRSTDNVATDDFIHIWDNYLLLSY